MRAVTTLTANPKVTLDTFLLSDGTGLKTRFPFLEWRQTFWKVIFMKTIRILFAYVIIALSEEIGI